jgi:hypothetical protein
VVSRLLVLTCLLLFVVQVAVASLLNATKLSKMLNAEGKLVGETKPTVKFNKSYDCHFAVIDIVTA